MSLRREVPRRSRGRAVVCRAGPRAPTGPQPYVSARGGVRPLPGDAWDPDVKVCMLIVRERKQDSRCSKPKSHGDFDVRI